MQTGNSVYIFFFQHISTIQIYKYLLEFICNNDNDKSELSVIWIVYDDLKLQITCKIVYE